MTTANCMKLSQGEHFQKRQARFGLTRLDKQRLNDQVGARPLSVKLAPRVAA
jgi:hypothetical protein